MDKPARKRPFRLSYLLLLISYVAMMWVPYYNRIEPEIAGIPFFYWYQLLWIVLGALILLPAYLSDTRGSGAP
jgi:hypothetical protein